jgi:hypothetical protein
LAPGHIASHVLGVIHSGLPDGIFSNQKSIFGEKLQGYAMEEGGIVHGSLVYLMYGQSLFLGPLGIFYGHFGTFFPFWYFVTRKIWQPWIHSVWLIDN